MPWYPDAVKRPVTGHTNGRMKSYRGIVLHCNDADSGSLYGWIMSNPNGMSCHFQVFKDGTIEQYIDTANSSWCQGGGNDDWLSLETSGKAGVPLTDAQVAAIVSLLRWVADIHGIPLQLADTPSSRGFGWHGMAAAVGNTSWGHALCPGVRRDQRAQMLAAATGAAPASGTATPIQSEEDDMTAPLSADNRDTIRQLVREVISEGPGQLAASGFTPQAGSFAEDLSETRRMLAVILGAKEPAPGETRPT